ncbi:MAG: hypothetical protein ACKO96_15175, partial [Flammeovirgaceae bacterium]
VVAEGICSTWGAGGGGFGFGIGLNDFDFATGRNGVLLISINDESLNIGFDDVDFDTGRNVIPNRDSELGKA